MAFLIEKDAIRITLPSPRLGNTVSADVGLITKISRLGTQHQYYNQSRREILVKHYQFSVVKEDVLLDLRAFITDTLGQEVFVTDMEKTFIGVVNPELIELTTMVDGCSYDFELDIFMKPDIALDVLMTQDGEPILTQDGQNILIQGQI